MTGSRDKTLRLWDVETGQTTSIFKNHTGQVWCLQVLRMLPFLESQSVREVTNCYPPQFDETKIVSGSDDKRLNVWDIVSGKLVTSLNGHSWGVRNLQPDFIDECLVC